MSENVREMTVEGPTTLVRGFVAGLLAARGLGVHAIHCADDLPLAREGLIEQVAEWVRPHKATTEFLVPGELHEDLKAALEQGKPLGLRLASDRIVTAASFDFAYEAYNRRHATELDALVKRFADRVRISDDYRPSVTVDPEAKGVEVYSPAHEFHAIGKGSATGGLEAILEFHRAAKAHPMMEITPIKLHHADD